MAVEDRRVLAVQRSARGRRGSRRSREELRPGAPGAAGRVRDCTGDCRRARQASSRRGTGRSSLAVLRARPLDRRARVGLDDPNLAVREHGRRRRSAGRSRAGSPSRHRLADELPGGVLVDELRVDFRLGTRDAYATTGRPARPIASPPKPSAPAIGAFATCGSSRPSVPLLGENEPAAVRRLGEEGGAGGVCASPTIAGGDVSLGMATGCSSRCPRRFARPERRGRRPRRRRRAACRRSGSRAASPARPASPVSVSARASPGAANAASTAAGEREALHSREPSEGADPSPSNLT